jgi:soluble lytic murein transglycosylase-like protein
MSQRLRARKKPSGQTRIEFLETSGTSPAAGLETGLVLGLIQVESGFRKYAISSRRRAGLHAGDAVLDARDRRRRCQRACSTCRPTCAFGCVILRHYLDREKGDLFMALGATTAAAASAEYPNLVFGARRQWLIA